MNNDDNIWEIFLHRIHQYRDSLFSSSSGFNNFRGFFTLALILLVSIFLLLLLNKYLIDDFDNDDDIDDFQFKIKVLATLRVALENVIKYGILINYSEIFWLFLGHTSIWPTIISLSLLNIFIYCSYWIEKRLSKVSVCII